MPVAGEVQEFNEELEGNPELLNEDPYGNGWIIKVKVSDTDLSDLMDAEAYKELVA